MHAGMLSLPRPPPALAFRPTTPVTLPTTACQAPCPSLPNSPLLTRAALLKRQVGSSLGSPLSSVDVPESCTSKRVEWDVDNEADRRLRRRFFTFDDWRRHRSNSRFLHHLSTIMESGIIRGVRIPVLCIILFTTVVAFYHHVHALGQLPCWIPAPPIVAIDCLGVTSFALGLLLVFRTNASYARWVEARRSYGSICTISRDVGRQVHTWFRVEDVELKSCLSRWLVALAKSAMMQLRCPEEHSLYTEMKDVLLPHEIDLLSLAGHKPTFCIQIITRIIKKAEVPEELVIRIDANLSQISSAVSACERILNTPIPLSYTRHTGRFLMFWMAALPWALWPYCGWTMVFLMALISFVLLGIEEIGVHIEEPFSLLPLELLAARLQVALQQIANDHARIDAYLE